VEDVFSRPRHPYTAALLSANPAPDPDQPRRQLELHGEVPSLLRRPSGCEFHTRCPRSQPPCREAFPPATHGEGERAYHCHFPLG
jgi:oligopeptide/dipeptide ABC transporter ATP-binding protein